MNAPQPLLLTCATCGEMLRLPIKNTKGAACPVCGAAVVVPPKAPAPAPVVSRPLKPRPVDPEITGTQEDDGTPYGLSGSRRYQCPACARPLEADAVFCVHCGLNLNTGQTASIRLERVHRHWTTGLSPAWRLGLFAVCQLIFLGLGLWVGLAEDEPLMVLGPWPLYSFLTAYLLGTFDRIDFERTTKGDVKLCKTWRYCFLRWRPRSIPSADFIGVSTSLDRDAGISETVVMIILFFCAILPGILWWLLVIERPVFLVTLTGEHGNRVSILYRGRSERQMHQIADTLCDVGGLVRF